MNRGDLWIVAGGVYASKPRPALIIRDDFFASEDSVTVLPLSTQLNEPAPLIRPRIPASPSNGLNADSDVMIDMITSIRFRNATARIGRITDDELTGIERLLGAYLGLAR